MDAIHVSYSVVGHQWWDYVAGSTVRPGVRRGIRWNDVDLRL
jgi:hypothetical protein